MSPVMKDNQSQKNFSKLIYQIVSANGRPVKLGIDLYARDGVVCVQIDGSLPQRPLRLSHPQLVSLVGELIKAELNVYACYEAGPCGYGLYPLGLENARNPFRTPSNQVPHASFH
jgi:hypothetical protein